MWGNNHRDVRAGPTAPQAPQNGPGSFMVQGLGKRPRPAEHSQEDEEAIRLLNAAGSWGPLLKLRASLMSHSGQVDGQQQASLPLNAAMQQQMQLQQQQQQPHPQMLQKFGQMLFRQQQMQAEHCKGAGDPSMSYPVMPPQARPDASTLTRMSESESMYSHPPPQASIFPPTMSWAHDMHASSSSFGSLSKDANRHDSDDGSWDGNGNDRMAPSDAQMAYLKEKESSGQALTAEEKLFLTRERNRDHSRKSRMRKKMYVEGLKATITDLSAYRMLVEMCDDLISVHAADEKMTVVFASAAFQRVMGFESERLLGKDFVALIHPEDAARVRVAMQNALVYGDAAQVVFRLMGADGAWRNADSSFRLHQLRQIIAVTRITPSAPPGPTAPATTSPKTDTAMLETKSKTPQAQADANASPSPTASDSGSAKSGDRS